MKLDAAFMLLCASLVFAVQARAAVLPGACGDDKVKFDVTTQKDQPAPALPQAGKAQIVFIGDGSRYVGAFTLATVRFGLDGAWVGASQANSYFTVTVEPGVHHICASLQGRKDFDLAPINAEPGKVYYFAGQVTETKWYDNFVLMQLNDDQGQYRVKTWKLSTSKIKVDQD